MPNRFFSKASVQSIMQPDFQRMDLSQVSTLSGMVPQTSGDWILCGLMVVGLFVICYGSFIGNVFQPLIYTMQRAHWSKAFIRPSVLWGTTGSAFLAFRTILWFLYRPFPPACHRDAPSLTVIIPVYNEGNG